MPAQPISRLSLFAALAAMAMLASSASSQGQTQTLNVTTFGARGDAVQIWANTVSNSTAVTCSSASFTSADVGKAVELFGVGKPTVGTNHQDLITLIAKVSDGTNITVLNAPSATATNVYCIIGTNNAGAFQSAIDAASGTNTLINIPAGNYLLIPPQQFGAAFNAWYMSSLVLTKGGIHFLGAGRTNTVLIGCGAWQLLHNNVKNQTLTYRGFLFTAPGYITNNYPLIIENLTMDGGLQYGCYGSRDYPARQDNGQGWDDTHGAYVDATGTRFNSMSIVNCQVQHWRGEMMKCVGDAKNGFLSVTNCVFWDGNATALNLYAAHSTDHCVFTNMFQVEEFYQLYNTNGTSYFQNNLIQGGSGVAVNGGTGTNPPYVLSNNVFYVTGNYGIETTPGDNLFILNNQFIGNNTSYGIGLGVNGYQGYFINSNIWVANNSFSNICPMYFSGAANGNNAIASVVVSNNTLVGNNTFATSDPSTVATNVLFTRNTGGKLSNNATAADSQWFIDDGSNKFTPWMQSGDWSQPNDAGTFAFAYSAATSFSTPYAGTAATFYLSAANCASHCAAGSTLTITNNSVNGYSLPIYCQTDANDNPVGAPLNAAPQSVLTFTWNGSAWTTNSVTRKLPSPQHLRLTN